MNKTEEFACVQAAVKGSKHDLTRIVELVHTGVYNLAMRFLWQAEDAQDATQEILISVVTHLSTFRGDSSLRTWVYRVATNYLINSSRSKAERREMTFDQFSLYTKSPLDTVEYSAPDRNLLTEEVKLSCSTGLLLCLNREQRIAYLLGEVFEVTSEEGAFIMQTNAANFRKRLSLGRDKIRQFMSQHCGLVNKSCLCRCNKRIQSAIESNRIQSGHLNFASQIKPEAVQAQVEQLIEVSALYKTHPVYQPPGKIVEEIRKLIDSGRFTIMGDLN